MKLPNLLSHATQFVAGLIVFLTSLLVGCGGGGDSSNSNGNVTAITVFIPDTGQTASYTTTFGEDSDYTINSPSYTDNGDGTITDNVTNLVWQKDDDGTLRTWSEATAYCGSLSLPGMGWRLPTTFELVGIAAYSSTILPNINLSYFPTTKLGYYWAATPYAGNTGATSSTWGFLFNGGVTGYNDNKTYTSFVRCVRGVLSYSRFSDNGNGTVTDAGRNLIWQKQDDGTVKSWEQALLYCDGLSVGGFTDWRLPNVKELNALVDYTTVNPAINSMYFPNTQSAYYWTSTTNTSAPTLAFLVSFGGGNISGTYDKTSLHYSRCVRGGI
ncbi:MAG TPA: DUF1566 domain-containing protein [Gallionellaceae bacterium]